MAKDTTITEERKQKVEKTYGGMTRRTLCLGVGAAAVAVGVGGLKLLPAAETLRPPGAQDEENMLSACIRCQRCYESCPREVIAPAHIEDGIVAMRTPIMDFRKNWCDFCLEENDGVPLCSQACPTGAIKPTQNSQDSTAIIGVADLNQDLCLAYSLIGCRFCYDACTFDAIELDGENRPHLVLEQCNGCGACESVCVSMKNGSIAQGATRRAIIVVPDSGSTQS